MYLMPVTTSSRRRARKRRVVAPHTREALEAPAERAMPDTWSDNDGFFAARTLFAPEHERFRSEVRRFVETELVPRHDAWEKAGVVSREIWRRAGEVGILCPNLPEAYGG